MDALLVCFFNGLGWTFFFVSWASCSLILANWMTYVSSHRGCVQLQTWAAIILAWMNSVDNTSWKRGNAKGNNFLACIASPLIQIFSWGRSCNEFPSMTWWE
jgi:hypothetical protein